MDEAVRDRRQKRRTDTVRAIRTGRTDLEMWQSIINDPGIESWAVRAQAAARHIPPNVRVLDLGCCDMALERFLPDGCSYVPLDVVSRDDRTIVADLNKRVPKLDADFVVGLGVLEYLFDIPGVLRKIARQIPAGIFSYYPLEASPDRDRLSLAWVNALNSSELIALFKYAGYRHVEVVEYASILHFYRVSRTAP